MNAEENQLNSCDMYVVEQNKKNKNTLY